MTTGDKIKRLREIRNITQAEMAERLSLSLSAYGKIERSETGLSFDKIKEIAHILNISIAALDEFDNANSVHIHQPNSTLTNCQQGEFSSYGNLSDNERKLYEDNIKLLEEIIRIKDELLKSKL